MHYELVIIGAGISGLASALAAWERGVEKVLILDYEKEKGGFTQPLFAGQEFSREQELMGQAAKLPYDIWTKSTVVGFFPGESGENHQLFIQSPAGTTTIEAKRIVLASGSLEKPREAHRIAGTRPAGVMTPLMAANLVKRGYVPGNKIVLVGDGRISRGIGELLESNNCSMEQYSGNDVEVVSIKGISRLQEVQLKDLKSGRISNEACDTLIFSQGRIPCTFFLKGTPVERDHNHAVVVDKKGRTTIPMIFAVGSCTIEGDDNHGNSIDLAQETVYEMFRH